MRHVAVTEVAFCLLASAGVLFAPGGRGQPESSQSLAKNGAANASKTSVEAVGARQALTVAQFTEAVEIAKDKSDEDAAKEIEQLELTERLSSPELARLSGKMPGAISKAALMAIGDASVFLEPPQSEMLDKAVPDATEQQQIVSLAADYLREIIPRLPDFDAERITRAFEEDWTAVDNHGTHKPGALHPSGEFKARVLYRKGKEVVRPEGAEEHDLITRGTFGPILSAVIMDNLHSPMQWRGWENGPKGAMAVFQLHVPKKESHYEVSFPPMALGELPIAGPTGYHGEIGIDPSTGTILRLVLLADPQFGFDSIMHADIMLEYGPVVIGGKAYICPVRGVSVSRGSYRDGRHKTGAFILLDDVIFTDYHVFRSDIRILPD